MSAVATVPSATSRRASRWLQGRSFDLTFIVGMATLGRCYGTLPDVRGLVTRGPYRLVRHPLYFGEICAGLGLLIPIVTPLNAVIFAVFVGLQLWRSVNEERAIEAVFAEYAAYRARTRRVVPFIW